MKKFFVLILSLIFVISFCIGVHAEDTVPGDEPIIEGEVIPEEAPEGIPEDEPVIEPEENYGEAPDVPPSEEGAGGVSVDAILARVFEWWELNKAEIMSVVGLGVSAMFAAFGKHIANKISNLDKDTTKKIGESSEASNKKINELVDAYNKNAEETKALRESIESLAGKVDEVDKKTLETEEIEVGIARMLNAAFSRLKLPNGTKDVVGAELAQIIDKGHVNAPQEAVSDEDKEQD